MAHFNHYSSFKKSGLNSSIDISSSMVVIEKGFSVEKGSVLNITSKN